MAEWCAKNLRDCQAWHDAGFQLTTSSNEAAKLYDALLRQYASWSDCAQLGGMDKCLAHMLEAEPDAIMGQVISLGFEAMGTGRAVRLDDQYQKELGQLLKNALQRGSDYEKMHATAIHMFANDKMVAACEQWERILIAKPDDLLALKFAHDAYFYLGDKCSIRDSVARVMPTFGINTPCYSFLHGMYAFGLEECGQYNQAEIEAKKGLELNKFDAWATHALAHCMEMNGRADEGILFMESTVHNWSKSFMLACHNFWHIALFHLEIGNYDQVLQYYDKQIAERANSGAMLDIVDAASLLKRLELEGVTVGVDRWRSLLPLLESHLQDHILSFNDAHFRLILDGSDAQELRRNHQTSINNFVTRYSGDNCDRTRIIGRSICDAITFHHAGKHHDVIETLAPFRNNIYQIGGSNAQRDLFTQLLIDSALNSTDANDNQLALTLLTERDQLKQNSALGHRLFAKYESLKHIETFCS